MTDTNNEELAPSMIKKAQIDRVSLESKSSQKIERWLNQLQEATNGLLRLTKSDLVNFLIHQHTQEINKKELAMIRQIHYDPVKHLQWITPKLRDALRSGDQATVDLLQSEIKGIELSICKGLASSQELKISEKDNLPKSRKAKKQSSKDAAQVVRTDVITDTEPPK